MVIDLLYIYTDTVEILSACVKVWLYSFIFSYFCCLMLSESPFINGDDKNFVSCNCRNCEPARYVWANLELASDVYCLSLKHLQYYILFCTGSGNDDVYMHLMESRNCYDAMPYSSKLVVFDTQLIVCCVMHFHSCAALFECHVLTCCLFLFCLLINQCMVQQDI